ncbi:hypothetical protein OJAV_G00061100 [Oryzias javanicus]|uniref:Uncharacterized protein n=1 Tax=Oryzias javanicus TaxID=123683 RepID=A0A3S2MR69_ORYJA|nr:hypothetical protein OJAV_G00061100 [Oryzias javanicus]
MRPVFVSFILVAAHISADADCRAISGPRRPRPPQPQHVTGGDKSGTRSSLGFEMRGDAFTGLLATNNFVSIFDLRRERFLCTDSSGQLIPSRRSPDCFLRRSRLNLAFPSPSGKQPPGARRRRRSKEVNPSDPLMSETHPSLPAKDGDKSQPDQDRAGAVSKETITSCDDPLRVLRPNGAGSPVKTNIADRAEHS